MRRRLPAATLARIWAATPDVQCTSRAAVTGGRICSPPLPPCLCTLSASLLFWHDRPAVGVQMDETSNLDERFGPDQAPRHDEDVVDSQRPHAARVYDAFLGGSQNLQVDRDFAEKIKQVAPFAYLSAHVNRAFLTRAVRYLSRQGVRQFIDIGCGLPTVEPVHEIAWQESPWAKVVYIDYEPLVVERMRRCIDEVDPEHKRLAVVKADLRDVGVVLGSEESRLLLDFNEPIGLLMVAALHFLGPGDAVECLVARYRDALPPGSYLAASHITRDGISDDLQKQATALVKFYGNTSTPGYYRTRAEFTALFDGFDLVEPGVVWAPEWHPDGSGPIEAPNSQPTLVGVGVL